MKFSIMLFILYLILKFLSFFSFPFKKRLREKNCIFLITTEKGKGVRYFFIRNGRIHSSREHGPKADVSVIWKDRRTGYDYMSCGNIMALIMAIKEGDLRLEGNAGMSLWLLSILSDMISLFKPGTR